MNITLTPEMERMVADRVASGRFSDATAVLQEALMALDESDRADREELQRFQAELQESFDQADRGEFVDADEMFAALRERGRLMRQAAA